MSDRCPAEVLALDESTTDQRCDEAWVAERRLALLRWYLGKIANRVGLPDQARRVTHLAGADEIESVGEAVLAELERIGAQVAGARSS